MLMEYDRGCVKRGVCMQRTHTRWANTGLVSWGARALNWGAAQGMGVVGCAGMCRGWGEREGEMRICGRA